MSKKASLHHGYAIKWLLVLYDLVIYAVTGFFLLFVYEGPEVISAADKVLQTVLAFGLTFASRLLFSVYKQVWRYGGIQCYLRMMCADAAAFLVNLAIRQVMPFERITISSLISLYCIALLFSLAIRMLYRYAYKFGNQNNSMGRFLRWLLLVFSGSRVTADLTGGTNRIKIAIVGAGRIGASLATDLIGNPNAAYTPRCFIDNNEGKIGKEIFGIPVISNADATQALLSRHEIQEVVIAIPGMATEEKKVLYDHYKNMGFKVKVYDYPTMRSPGSKMQLREFDIDELLFRREVIVTDEKTKAFYKGKVVLITGGGGSIGSELCRQVASMEPKKLIILDIGENGAYEVQQELKFSYPALDVQIEIISICDRPALERVFASYRPEIVLHAAAHKHVPLMEHNCVEAVKNNVFGTLNAVEVSEKYGAERFMMVSTDKAVNPTNVMGATKRMCEMIVRSHSAKKGKTSFSSTRFGNVLGSAGSVIPLFKKQIAAGGPITITDKRIIRYFMTIPAAASLVLQAGAMAGNGELFVLDMGKPVKILDLAENLIRLSGLEPYRDIDIIETGLRPGEKLYEELLVKDESLGKTDSDLIFIEKEDALSAEQIGQKLDLLRKAVEAGTNEEVCSALRAAVPTFISPEKVNSKAEQSEEFKSTK